MKMIDDEIAKHERQAREAHADADQTRDGFRRAFARQCEAKARQWRELRDSLPVGVPDGWKLVPVEPTPEMLEAAWNYHGSPAYTSEVRPDSLTDAECYRAMLAAAPAAPTVKESLSVVGVPDAWKNMDATFVVEHIRRTSVFDADLIGQMLEYAINGGSPTVKAEQVDKAGMHTLDAICDLFMIGRNARTHACVMANIENTKRFADLLRAIESEFFMVPCEPDEDNEPDDEPQYECLLNCWGSTQEQYVEQFRAALKKIAAPSLPVKAEREALQNMLAAFDNPIARRKLGGEFAQEAIASAKSALEAPSLPAAGSAGEEVKVVAWVYTDTSPEEYLHTKPFVIFARPDGAAPGPVTHENQQREPLMTVAQHERIDWWRLAVIDHLRNALRFYADGDHLLLADPGAWDTCSGEPVNFLRDEAGTASVEDGSIAKKALSALSAQQSAPAYGSYTTRPAEAVAGIALRQLGDESRWVEIRDLNAHAFPGIGPHDYYPVGTVLRMPAEQQSAPERVSVPCLADIDRYRIELLPEHDAGYVAKAYVEESEPVAEASGFNAVEAVKEVIKLINAQEQAQ